MVEGKGFVRGRVGGSVALELLREELSEMYELRTRLAFSIGKNKLSNHQSK